ncbi:hypothetical protein PsYK624_038890 [Phanerochaete sordida]|uniref:Uncharacterized protein n=1 Tax=Phanerochaete sordida TaxID=48140 RepID=A0A9P3L9Z0_9APHY|nr:hypothetical protein PsYK624_038890 [Phanerochaete sordida]
MTHSHRLYDGSLQFKNAVTAQGAVYEIGTVADGSKAAAPVVAAPAVQDAGKFELAVRWPVTNKMVVPPEDIQKTAGIIDFCVGDMKEGPYKYWFRFLNNRVQDYIFETEGGDIFVVHTSTTEHHFVKFTCEGSPTIIRFAGY